jgi:Set1/Ash2 histone methyltransferase complex subunit ASH2
MVRCTHGAASGAWYCEARIEHLGTTGHARLGWCGPCAQRLGAAVRRADVLARRATCSADLNAPVGYDKHGYGYRTAGGEKIHEAKREPYGGPSKEGDVVGMYICVSGAGPAAEQVRCMRAARAHFTCALRLTAQAGSQELVQLEGQAYRVEKRGGPAERIDGSAVAFAVNGVSQGVAFTGLCGGALHARGCLRGQPDEPVCARRRRTGRTCRRLLPCLQPVHRAFADAASIRGLQLWAKLSVPAPCVWGAAGSTALFGARRSSDP